MDAHIVSLCDVPTATETRLQAYLDAETKILGGQEVRFGERSLKLADLAMVQKQIGILQGQVAREAATTAGRGGRFSQADFSRRCD